MREIIVTEAEENQRFDKFLLKYMNKAPKSFVYKMLRKKNITLNGGKAGGGETLAKGDVVALYLAEETVEGFRERKPVNTEAGGVRTVYEDALLLVCDKPAGVLSHSGEAGDSDTMAHRILLHLWKNGEYDPSAPFTPGLANRLDRNTSGLVACGKTLAAAQWLAAAFRERKAKRRYKALVRGNVTSAGRLTGLYEKDEAANRAVIYDEFPGENPGAAEAETLYEPLWSKNGCSYLDVTLVTGKSHQIRAQLAHAGYPVVGDGKYGDERVNAVFKRGAGVKSQLLHADSLTFTEDAGVLAYLAGRAFETPPPPVFGRVFEFVDTLRG